MIQEIFNGEFYTYRYQNTRIIINPAVHWVALINDDTGITVCVEFSNIRSIQPQDLAKAAYKYAQQHRLFKP